MKAFLLAAGLGTRLRPLTDTVPKCLVPICGKPLLAWWLELFTRHGVDCVLINTHYLREPVQNFIREYSQHHLTPKITEFYEPELLGSGGTVAANRDFIGNDPYFFICYADNLTNADLSALKEYHRSADGVLTMALFHAPHPEQCGIAQQDAEGRIVSFEEKPLHPVGNLANAGIYIANKSIFSYLPQSGFCDFGRDILPKLVGRMYGFELREYLLDIGTPENLRRGEEEWRDNL